MTLRVGILPHADLPHLIPCFRRARELLKCGHDVRIFGSDVSTIRRGHSEAWRDLLARFGLHGRQVMHDRREVTLSDWLKQQAGELQLDMIILDAVWQGLAFGCADAVAGPRVVVHHAGLPDFRGRDMPAWQFVHPGHTPQRWAEARRAVEAMEQAGQGIRTLLSSIKAHATAGRAGPDAHEFGCGEFADVPAIRAMSMCPPWNIPTNVGEWTIWDHSCPSLGMLTGRRWPPSFPIARSR